MKVHYKKTILEKLTDAVTSAVRERKKIDYFELTSMEAEELRISTSIMYPTGLQNQFFGYPIKVVG